MSIVAEYPKQVNQTLNRVLSQLIKGGFQGETLLEFMEENEDALKLAAVMGDYMEVYDLALNQLLGHGTLDVFKKYPEFCDDAARAGVSLERLAYHYKMGDLADQEATWRAGVPIEDVLA